MMMYWCADAHASICPIQNTIRQYELISEAFICILFWYSFTLNQVTIPTCYLSKVYFLVVPNVS